MAYECCHGCARVMCVCVRVPVVDSIYWAVVTCSTVGFGDLSSAQESTRYFCACAGHTNPPLQRRQAMHTQALVQTTYTSLV